MAGRVDAKRYAGRAQPLDLARLLASSGQALQISVIQEALRASNDALQREVQEQLERARLAEAAKQVPPPYAADALKQVRIAGFPLQGVLVALETVTVPGVSLVSVNVDATTGLVRVEVQFGAYVELLSYVEQLNAGEPTQRWTLSQARVTAAGQPALATIESRWSGSVSDTTPPNEGVSGIRK